MKIQLQDRTLGQWMEYWAETTPDKEYLVYSDRDLRFTWKEFNGRVDRMAKGMLSIGIKHGTHVGIWATNVPDCNRQYELQAERTGIPGRKCGYSYDVHH